MLKLLYLIPACFLFNFFTSCRKSEPVKPRIIPEDDFFKFQVLDLNYHCRDYRGRIAVKLKCLYYPQTAYGYVLFQYNNADSIFMSTTVPENYLQNKAVFSAEVDPYLDWQDKTWCQTMGTQIKIENVQ